MLSGAAACVMEFESLVSSLRKSESCFAEKLGISSGTQIGLNVVVAVPLNQVDMTHVCSW